MAESGYGSGTARRHFPDSAKSVLWSVLCSNASGHQKFVRGNRRMS
ncbi:hypothetical protein DGo_PC0215 (plasmid) [Deinococcus gobiensis I-0]|uniref:Uncharacterized protein n=1 Tax=Deinococcus gobiensis (strain DSM 21396 / JCM 16679 / CGMCC 1.7299 / I-0) TaxID=745776 RepID=H8H3B0_DEIGI|nr:hypothetical protein DGo_PC0215 [Deinococcus gobiensis I-0]